MNDLEELLKEVPLGMKIMFILQIIVMILFIFILFGILFGIVKFLFGL